MQTSREIVTRALKFESPERLPREIWRLPWAMDHAAETMREIDTRWSGDIGGPANVYRPSKKAQGYMFGAGKATDPWGCVFENIFPGIHGEVKDPVLKDLNDWKCIVEAPLEMLPDDYSKARDAVNRDHAASDKFMRGGLNPRPWEQYQFFRGSEEAMMDIIDPDENVLAVLKTLHEFYLREVEFWVSTDVDAIGFMDDWGSQRSLLIPPDVWRAIFKPMYKDYIDLAHAAGKFAFMHSDGCIKEIYPDIVEIGVDALNSQLFVMDMEQIANIAKGRLTFWGEIDRQHVLPAKDPQVGRDAVRKFAKNFYDPSGGIIINFEFGPDSNPDTAIAICEEWDAVHAGIPPAS